MARRDTTAPRVISFDGGAESMTPIPLSDERIDAGWLQKLLDWYPDVLPIAEIDPGWGPLISLGRDLPTGCGRTHNLFVSPSGELTIVGATAWRNPAARRAAVRELIERADEISQLGYDGLNDVVAEADPSPERAGLWARVHAALPSEDETAESVFVDRVTRNLFDGRFLLLIAGDGIRSNPVDLADLVDERVWAECRLEFVELAPYFWQGPEPDDDRIVVMPRLNERAVAEPAAAIPASDAPAATDAPAASGDDSSDAGTIDLRDERPTRDRTPMASMDEFAARLTEATSADETERILALIDWWRTDCEGHVRLNKASVNLSATYSPNRRGVVSVLTIGVDGVGTASVEPLAEWSSVISRTLVEDCCAEAGFTGNPGWPVRALHLTVDDNWDQVTVMLASIATEVADAEANAAVQSSSSLPSASAT